MDNPFSSVISGIGSSISSVFSGQKQAEVVDKLQQNYGANADKFKALNSNVTICKKDADIVLASKVTNKTLVKVAKAATKTPGLIANQGPQLPANNTPSFKAILMQSEAMKVVFNVSPSITEGRHADYDALQPPLHHPGQILKYKSTQNRTWHMSVKLISRNSLEASENLRIINLIRSWVMPYYGTGTATNTETAKFLGAPPPILKFSCYGSRMIGPVNCVLTNYGWDFPNDVDYIPTAETNPIPFPVIMNITLDLAEAFSPAEYSSFDLVSYRQGNLNKAFAGNKAPKPVPKGATKATAEVRKVK